MAERMRRPRKSLTPGLSDDLYTARALAAAFDLVREANIRSTK